MIGWTTNKIYAKPETIKELEEYVNPTTKNTSTTEEEEQNNNNNKEEEEQTTEGG